MKALLLVGLAMGPLTCLGIDDEIDDPVLQEAHRIWVEDCAVCHGVDGRGPGPTGKTLDPSPPDFHDPCLPDTSERIRGVILSGGATFGGSETMRAHHGLAAKPEVLAKLVEFILALRSQGECKPE